MPVAGVEAATDVAARLSHACAIAHGGTVRCWGANEFGQLGDGTLEDRPSSVGVIGLQDSALLAQGNTESSCVTQSSGSASCWGRNEFGMLGDGATTNQAAPVPVLVSEVSQLASGRLHACAVQSTGAVSCWGRNAEGQLGDGTVIDRTQPGPVPSITDAAQVACGYAHTCLLRRDGTVACWGANDSGQLGTGTTGEPSVEPVTVTGLPVVKAISVGSFHSCALLQNGSAACWGDNGAGQLGDGTIEDRAAATAVGAVTGIASLAAGDHHTCAALDSGEVRCWGWNVLGELGDGTTSQKNLATAVVGLP